MRLEMRPTTKKVTIKYNGKNHWRKVYEFFFEDRDEWVPCIRLGSFSLYQPRAFCPLEHFDYKPL